MVECSQVCRAQHDNQSWCKFQDDVLATVASQKPCHLSTSVVPTEGGARVVHALLWCRRRPFVWHLRQVADIVFGLAISISWVTPMARAAWLGRSWGGLGQREFDLNASWEQEVFVFLQLLAQQDISILDCLNPLQPGSYVYQAVGHMFKSVVPSHWWRSPKVQSRDVHQMSLSRQPIYLKGTSDAKLADATLLTEHSSKNDSLQTSRVSQYIVSYSIGVLPCIMLYACHEWILCRICAPNALRTSVFVWFVYGHGCLCPKAPRRYMSQGLAQSSRINDVRSNSPNPSVAPTMDRWQLYAQHLTSPKHLWEVIQLVLQDVASRRLEHCKGQSTECRHQIWLRIHLLD